MSAPSPKVREQMKKEMQKVEKALDEIVGKEIPFSFKSTKNKPEGLPRYVSFEIEGKEAAKLYWEKDPNILEVYAECADEFERYIPEIQIIFECNVDYVGF